MMRALPRTGEDQMAYPKRDGTLFGIACYASSAIRKGDRSGETLFGIACYASSAIRKGDRSGELRRNTHFIWRLRYQQKNAYHLPLEA